MSLKLGDTLPNIECDSSIGALNLHEYWGQDWGILFSHPADYTPVCTTELGEAARLASQFSARNVKMVALSCSDADSHRGWLADIQAATGQNVTYPIIADPSRVIAMQLGMLSQDHKDAAGLPLTVRSVFVVGPDKKIKLMLTYPASTGRNFAEIIRCIDSLQMTAYQACATPVNWTQGQDVVIVPTVSNEDAITKFPSGFRTLQLPSGKSYLRFTADPTTCSARFPQLAALIATQPKPGVYLGYGTAGFRTKAELLPSTFLRMGMLAALRSRKLSSASKVEVIGLMVTASHNPEADNGIKMVDPDGGMLEQAWERHAMTLANSASESVCAALDAIIREEGIDMSRGASVFMARDTRASSEGLSALALAGARAFGASVRDYGLLTTPQLHHIVRMTNCGETRWASEEGYYAMLAEGYQALIAAAEDPAVAQAARGKLLVDGAHGIGAPQTLKMIAALNAVQAAAGAAALQVEVRNPVGGPLNLHCGAEHVQKGRVPPGGVDAASDAGVRACSLDGDADRVVYHFFDAAGAWHLLDGDKIAALAAAFIKDNLTAAGIGSEFSMAAVQTAYANGASTNYIRSLGVDVPMAKTGVKFVHHKAMEYDIGLYFEANGHGTVVFQPRVLARLDALAADAGAAPGVAAAVRRLRAAVQLINQAVGDAISDFLMVEAVLQLKGWSVQDWDATYQDLPSRQTKLAVADRSVVTCTEDETRCLSPPGLQEAIDAAVARYPSGRGFVRPSGTEDVVRVYAEAATEEMANALAHEVAMAAFTHAGGVGNPPEPIGSGPPPSH